MARGGGGGGWGGGYRGGGTGWGGGGSGLNRVLDDYDAEMLDLFLMYATEATAAWEGFSGNNGQLAIVHNHILPAVEQHVGNAKNQWPRGETPEDYISAIYAAYDPDVMYRAFNQTIDETFSAMAELWAEAEHFQSKHDAVALVMGSQPAPHSTEGVWKGMVF